jgi:hypothetical protein
VDVYPRNRTVWSAILVYGSLAAIAAVWAVAAVAHGSSVRGWWVAILGLAIFPYALWRTIGQLGHPLPWAHLDEEGLDCALGRVPWRNVASASVAWHWVWAGRGSHPSRRLFLYLRNPAEAPTANTREYLSGVGLGGPVESGGKVRVPLWGSKEQVLADVGRYYSTA